MKNRFRQIPPPLEAFLKYFHVVASKEIAVVYNMIDSRSGKGNEKITIKTNS